jgi:hypothetical protein|nr:MAG TPA: N-acetylmuramoyl-L-alanine amidase [Myoviridae sp. ctNPX13]
MSNVLSRSEMTKVSLSDIKAMAQRVYWSLWSQAREYGRDVKIYLHWTAGHYGQFWDDYHIQIDKDGSMYVPTGVELDDILYGTWRRNTGSIAVTMLGCANMTPEAVDPYEPPTKAQIETMAQVITVLANALDLTIDKARVMTHGEAADNEDGVWCHEPYGPKSGALERWDLEYLGTPESPVYDPYGRQGYQRGGDVLRGKANWYRKVGIKGVYPAR